MTNAQQLMAFLAMLGVSAWVAGQGPPATKMALPDGPITMRVIDFIGDVAIVRGNDFEDVKTGMALNEGTELMVGQRSSVKIDVGANHIITVRRLGSVVLTKAAVESGTIDIDVGMKYGQTAVEGEAQDRAIRTSVHTPSATLGIRNTQVAISDQPPFAPEVVSLTGHVQYSDLRKRVSLGSKGGGKARVNQDNESAAETALASSYVDPSISAARSPSEQALVAQVLSTGADVTFQGGFPIVRGGTPPSFQNLEQSLPAGLVYLFKWNGNINFNFTVSLPDFNETIYPVAGSNHGQHGFTAFDHQGGPKGGYEELVFPPGFPGSQPSQCGMFDYIRRADYVPNGNDSGYELRIYTNSTLNRSVTGEVLANGKVKPEVTTNFAPFCPPPAQAAAASASAAADCGCSTPSAPASSQPLKSVARTTSKKK